MFVPGTGRRARRFALTFASAALFTIVPASANAAFDEVEQITESGWRNAMVTTPQGETVIAWQEPVEDPDAIFGHREELWVAIKPADGPLGEPQLISRNIADCSIQLEVDAEGNVALSFSRWSGSEVSTALKRPGEDFAEPLAVPEPDNNGGNGYRMDVAGGDVAVGFTHYDIANSQISSVYRATTSEDGAPYSEPTTLEKSDPVDYWEHETGFFDIALAPDGELTMIWARQDEYDGPWRVQTAYLSPAGTPSRVQTLVESPIEKSCPQVDADAAGNVAALWMEDGCAVDSLYLATRPPASQFGEPTMIANSSWIYGPELDVAPDGTITVGYSDGSGVNTLIGSFDDPIEVVPGPLREFVDLSSASAGSSVLASRTGYPAITVGKVTESGEVEPGPWIETDAYYAVTAPLGDDRAALLFYDYGAGLIFTTSSLEPTQEPGVEPPPPVPPPSDPPPPDPPPSDAPQDWTVEHPDSLPNDGSIELWDDGIPRQALSRKLRRMVACSLHCTVRASARVMVPTEGRDATFRLRHRDSSGIPNSPFEVRLPIKAKIRHAATKALEKGKTVLAELRLAASGPEGPELRRELIIELVAG